MIQPVKGGLADLARGNWAGSLVVTVYGLLKRPKIEIKTFDQQNQQTRENSSQWAFSVYTYMIVKLYVAPTYGCALSYDCASTSSYSFKKNVSYLKLS